MIDLKGEGEKKVINEGRRLTKPILTKEKKNKKKREMNDLHNMKIRRKEKGREREKQNCKEWKQKQDSKSNER